VRYTIPCSADAPKTCECVRQCTAAGVNFMPPGRCLNSTQEVLAELDRCDFLDYCNHKGWYVKCSLNVH
jgi:hypothetical protein